MSYTLILDAGSASPINLVVQQAGENQPIEVGTISQSANGADRTTVRATKRTFGALTSKVETAVKDSIINKLKNGRQIPCSGDLLANIQTQCTMRYTGARMIPGLVDIWEVGLTGNEVQPNNVLLKYAPGDTITGESFTRSTVGYSVNAAGTLVSNAINVKRDNHYIGGVRSLLLEGPATNSLLWSADFNNAAWTKATMTVGTGIADPTGGTGAQTLTATAGGAQAYQTLAAGSSIVRTSSMWIRRRTGTGTVRLIAPDLTFSSALALTASWQRFSVTSAASTGRTCGIDLATSGDAVDVYIGQLDNTSFVTSEIVTTTVAVTRGADLYSLPLTTPPQEMTPYMKFVELGTIKSNVNALTISNAAEAAPFFRIQSTVGGQYQSAHNNAAFVTSTLGDAPVLQDIIELAPKLFGDGGVDNTQSRNGAASTSSAQSAANALGTAWSGQLVWLNSEGSVAQGFIALRSFKLGAGMRSLDEMRAA